MWTWAFSECLLWILAAIGEGVFSFREPSLKTGGHICLGQNKGDTSVGINFWNWEYLDAWFLEWLLIFPGFSQVLSSTPNASSHIFQLGSACFNSSHKPLNLWLFIQIWYLEVCSQVPFTEIFFSGHWFGLKVKTDSWIRDAGLSLIKDLLQSV